jgi:hypothetical protein
MTITQGFPTASTQVIDENGNLTMPWYQFFVNLWNRTGSSVGNNSNTFPYPNTTGTTGQVLTNQGAAAAIWTTLKTALSQFTNDIGFITAAALDPYSTTTQMTTAITNYVLQSESNTTPLAVATRGAAGVSTRLARADHAHAQQASGVFTTVTASTMSMASMRATSFVGAAYFDCGPALNPTTWTSGSGVPTGTQPNGSIYTNATGTTGTRLYVSTGTAWNAVAGV